MQTKAVDHFFTNDYACLTQNMIQLFLCELKCRHYNIRMSGLPIIHVYMVKTEDGGFSPNHPSLCAWSDISVPLQMMG